MSSTVPSTVGGGNSKLWLGFSFGEWYRNLPGMTITKASNTGLYKGQIWPQKYIISWAVPPVTSLAVDIYLVLCTAKVMENHTDHWTKSSPGAGILAVPLPMTRRTSWHMSSDIGSDWMTATRRLMRTTRCTDTVRKVRSKKTHWLTGRYSRT